jgi:uncharacterized protein YjiS (DUF1127 family)
LDWQRRGGLDAMLAGVRRRHQTSRALSRLADLDDHMLADIGLTRSDLHAAYCEAFWRDPTGILERRISDRRTAFELSAQHRVRLDLT